MPLLLLLFLLLVLANVFIGNQYIPLEDIWAAMGNGDDEIVRCIVWGKRIPEVITAILAGTALAEGGLIMQTLFRNPLADPSILGVSAGASLGVILAGLLGGASAGLMSTTVVISCFALQLLLAFLGAMAIVALLTAASAWLKDTGGLLIVGVMLAFLISSLSSLLLSFTSETGSLRFLMWGMGSFSSFSDFRLALYAVGIGSVLLLAPLLIKPLDALLLGENYARSLGINVRMWRTILLLLVGWLTALTTAVCGPVAFIGLAVPHAARLLMKTASHRVLLPATLLIGSITTLACLLLMNLPGILGISNTLIPISALTPLLGAPIVIYILIKGGNL